MAAAAAATAARATATRAAVRPVLCAAAGGTARGKATAAGAAKATAGSIGDLFTSLGTPPPALGERFAQLKASLRPEEVALEAAWHRLRASVAENVREIRERGSEVIPCVDLGEIEANGGAFPPEAARLIRQRGCVVVRNTVPGSEALRMKAETQQYIAANREGLGGFPVDRPQVWEVYWATPQLRMRQHSGVVAAQTALNRLWHCRAAPDATGQVAVDVHRSLSYCDRLRIRDAGDTSFTLGPHVDGGSTERWEDAAYRQVYQDIFNCNWEQFDPFDATHRADVKYDLYQSGVGACSIFRSFQGWVSLSSSGRGQGALQVVPMLREAIAYILLRPFLADVPAASFCGANPGKVQDLFPEFHQDLINGIVAVPDVGPGDSVWWHCDLVHAVEGAHGGNEDSSVFYIPAVPLCMQNAEYVQRQSSAFLSGRTPPDFPANHFESSASGRGVAEDLSEAGRRAMGLRAWPEQRAEGEPREAFEASRLLRGRSNSLLPREATGAGSQAE